LLIIIDARHAAATLIIMLFFAALLYCLFTLGFSVTDYATPCQMPLLRRAHNMFHAFHAISPLMRRTPLRCYDATSMSAATTLRDASILMSRAITWLRVLPMLRSPAYCRYTYRTEHHQRCLPVSF